jgi:hypothetical protein
MRVFISLPLITLAMMAAPAQAAKIVIVTDPMTLERRMVVLDQPGPDRIYVCAMPPAVAGCREVTPRGR